MGRHVIRNVAGTPMQVEIDGQGTAPEAANITVTGATTAAATSTAGAANITSASLTTAAAGTWVLTITNKYLLATSVVDAAVGYGTATTGVPYVLKVVPAAGSVVMTIANIHASAALNGTIIVSYAIFN